MYNNDANQANQNHKSKNHDTNEAYQDDETRSNMSNDNTGVTDDPKYEADQANEGSNQDQLPDEEYTTDINIDIEEEGDRITIEDINITPEMNTSQMAIEQQSMEKQEEDTSSETPRHTHRYNLRKCPTRNTSMTQMHRNTGVASCDIMTIHPKIHAHIMLRQMNVKQGLVKYGEKGSQAVLKELRQLHNIGALLPVKKEDMSYDVKRKALRYLMFLKEKCDGTI